MEFSEKNGLESYRHRDIRIAMRKIHGAKYDAYREKWDAPPVLTACPLHLDVDLYDACNQSCAMCHQAYRKRTGMEITPSLIDKVISETGRLGLCSVNFGASCEPLLKPELLLHALKSSGEAGIMDSFIHTNALLLTEDIARGLLANGLKHLCVSLDAATEATYKKVRRAGTLEAVEGNIKKLLEARGDSFFPELRVSFCVTPLNRHERDMFLDKWAGVADLVEFQGFRAVDGLDFADDGARLIRESCHEGLKRGMLWPNGDVTPCCGVWDDLVFGNVTGASFAEVWQSERAGKIRLQLREGARLPKVCRMCLGHAE